jgi:hypothetical protein
MSVPPMRYGARRRVGRRGTSPGRLSIRRAVGRLAASATDRRPRSRHTAKTEGDQTSSPAPFSAPSQEIG